MNIRTRAESYLASLPYIFAAVVLAGFGLEGFILPNMFIDGGITGISILLSFTTGLPIAVFLFLVNIPFIALAWVYISRRTAVLTLLSVLGLVAVLTFINFPIVTHDKLLSAIFGGIFLGAGIGMALQGGSTLDGTEILALILSRRTSFTVGNIISVLNAMIFLAGLWVIGVEACLYSILTYIAASRAVDFLLYGLEEYYAVIIISPRYEQIKREIYRQMERGVTIYDGSGGYTDEKLKILYCVITRLETTRIKRIIHELDSRAFVVYQLIKDAHGGLTRKRYMKP